MGKAQLMAELERELLVLAEEVEVRQSRIHALRDQLKFLKTGTENVDEIAGMRRTDAILAVLRKHGLPLTPSEIHEYLKAVGRNDKYNSITATLNHLRLTERIYCPTDGQYTAS